MNLKLTVDLEESIRLVKIENKRCPDLTYDDVVYVIELADKKTYPRAEYLASCMYLLGCGVAKNPEIGLEYLEKCSKHAGYSLKLKIAGIYHKLGN